MSKSILLAEDDRFLRRACETKLKQAGFDVRVAVDGEESIGVTFSELLRLAVGPVGLLVGESFGVRVTDRLANARADAIGRGARSGARA